MVTEREFEFCHAIRFPLKMFFHFLGSNNYSEFSSSTHGLYSLVLVAIQIEN